VCDGAPHAAMVRVAGIGGAPVRGSVVVTYGPGGLSAPTLAGTYSISAAFTTADPNYGDAGGTGAITITPAPVVATLTYPAPDSGNPDLSQPLQWTRVFDAQAYYVYGGSTRGAKDLINSGEIGQTSFRMPDLPGGQIVYVRLWTKVAGVWRFSDSAFTPPRVVASLTSPASGAAEVDPFGLLRWEPIASAQAYYLYVGSTAGARDLVNSGETLQTSFRLTGLPEGRTVCVRLWTKVGNIWRYSDTTFSTRAGGQ
jgi:hypothetical protein